GCLWIGARRTGHAAFNALAYPICGLLLVTMLLCYSRGALLAAAVGCTFWFTAVPLRLRGVAVLATSAAAALPVALWAFAQDGLKIFKAHKVLGVGAGGYGVARLRVREDDLDVRHAHGYLFQTLADFGLVGLAVSLALLAAWMAAAGRATGMVVRRSRLSRPG